MTDFYTLLKQSIADRGLVGESERQEMYAQARRAVIKQLWDYRPPLAADEIDTRVGTYDRAVERIEAEMQLAIASGEIAVRPQRSAAPPAAVARAVQRAPAARRTAELERTAVPTRSNAAPAARPLAAQHATRGNVALATPPRLAPPPPEEDVDDDEELLDEEYTSGEETVDERPRYRRETRWADRGRFEKAERHPFRQPFVWPDWLGGSQQQAIIRMAAILAGALFILLVALISYQLGARSSRTVTLPIGTHREVSDAATAARIPVDNATVAQTFTIFDGTDPTVFDTTPDNPISFDSAGDFARVSSSTSAPGVKVTIGPGVAARLAGHNVRVVIVARSSTESGAAGMRFAYQSGVALSHWQTANLGSDFTPLGIEWRVPAMRTSPDGDDLLIEPGIPGDGTGVDVKSIRIDVLAS